MFPEPVRNLTEAAVDGSFSFSKNFFSFSKAALWVFASSFTVLILPVICEQERSSIEELQNQQQRQIILGPSATVSAPNLIPGIPGAPATK
jgi:import receptor subunit TOM22